MQAAVVVEQLQVSRRTLSALEAQVPEAALSAALGKPGARAGLAALGEKIRAVSFEIDCAASSRALAAQRGYCGVEGGSSSADVLRDSAEQGALTKQVAGAQGLITEAGYEEQRQSYTTMAGAARFAAAGENDIANQTDQLANDTRALGKTQAAGDFASSLIKGVAGVASLFTGGASDLLGGLFTGGDGFKAEAPGDSSNPLVINRYGQPGPASSHPLGGLY
jgi:hypothetical protein